MPLIIMLAGPPASGKSTTSRALAATFPRSIHINVDHLRDMVVSGVVHPSTAWGDALVEQLRLARKIATEMAKTYHAAGFTVVIDDFLDPYSRLSEYAELFDMAELRRFVLFPEQLKAHAQNLNRSGPGALQQYLDEGIRIAYEVLNREVPHLVQEGWVVLDTTHNSLEETVARLRALLC